MYKVISEINIKRGVVIHYIDELSQHSILN